MRNLEDFRFADMWHLWLKQNPPPGDVSQAQIDYTKGIFAYGAISAIAWARLLAAEPAERREALIEQFVKDADIDCGNIPSRST